MNQIERVVKRVTVSLKLSVFTDVFVAVQNKAAKTVRATKLTTLCQDKVRRVLSQTLSALKERQLSVDASLANGLSKLSAFVASRDLDFKIVFLNELELLAHAYGLLFRRMVGLQWGDSPEFLSLSDLIRTYLQTLRKLDQRKYDSLRSAVKRNVDVYTVLLDDVLTSVWESYRRTSLLYSLHRIKQGSRLPEHDKHEAKKIERLAKVLTGYTDKRAKQELLELVKRVHTVQPKEGLLHKLQDIFDYYQLLHKQVGLNEMRLDAEKISAKERDKKAGLDKLRDLFDKRRAQTYNSLPHRSFFPMGVAEVAPEAFVRTAGILHSLYQKRLGEGFYSVRARPVDFLEETQLNQERKLDNVKTRLRRITERESLPLLSALDRMIFRRQATAMRRVIHNSAKNQNLRDRVLMGLNNMVVKRKLAAFGNLKHAGEEAKAQRMVALREALGNLDTFFKNRINQGRVYLPSLQPSQDHPHRVGGAECEGCYEHEQDYVLGGQHSQHLRQLVRQLGRRLADGLAEVYRVEEADTSDTSNRIIPRDLLQGEQARKLVESEQVVNTVSKIQSRFG